MRAGMDHWQAHDLALAVDSHSPHYCLYPTMHTGGVSTGDVPDDLPYSFPS